jgi:hypothetical protein
MALVDAILAVATGSARKAVVSSERNPSAVDPTSRITEIKLKD